MGHKDSARKKPEGRHIAAAGREFSDGMVSYALWNSVLNVSDELSDETKTRYIQLRAEVLATEESKSEATAKGASVEPYEVMLGRFCHPKLMTALPGVAADQFPRPCLVFTSRRLLILNLDSRSETGPIPAEAADFEEEVEGFWQGARSVITTNNNTITVRAIRAAIQTGAVISVMYEDLQLAARKLPGKWLDRLVFAEPGVELSFSGKFACAAVDTASTLTLRPSEPYSEIERVLRLLPKVAAFDGILADIAH